MQKKTKTEGTLLYPGVVLRGNNILMNPAPKIPQAKSSSSPRTIRKACANKIPNTNKEIGKSSTN